MEPHREDEPFVTSGSFGGPDRSRRSARSLVVLLVVLLVALTIVAVTAQELPPAPILVSRQLAEIEGLAVGDEVQLATDAAGAGARAFRIAGVYEPTPDPMRLGSIPREVRLHLPDFLSLTRDPSTPAGTEHVEAINVALVNPDEALEFARDVNARMPGVMARPASGAAGSRVTFVVLERFHLAIAAVTILAATVFLLA